LVEVLGERVDLAAPPLLPRAEQERAAVGDERRVVRVDRIRVARRLRLAVDDLCAGLVQEVAEGVVLGRGARTSTRRSAPVIDWQP
jgi:hypothetical protein